MHSSLSEKGLCIPAGTRPCCTNGLRVRVPFPAQTCHATSVAGMPSAVEPLRSATRAWARRSLVAEVGRRQGLTQQLETVHRCLGAASSAVAAPSSPDDPANAFGFLPDAVAGDCPDGVGTPGLGVHAGRNNRGRASGGAGVVALAGVEDATGGNGGDLPLAGALVEQVCWHSASPISVVLAPGARISSDRSSIRMCNFP